MLRRVGIARRRVRFARSICRACSLRARQFVTDSVEKVGRSFGFMLFGRFAAAEVSRLSGLASAGLAISRCGGDCCTYK